VNSRAERLLLISQNAAARNSFSTGRRKPAARPHLRRLSSHLASADEDEDEDEDEDDDEDKGTDELWIGTYR
jgi:hypothetical protein